VINTEPFFPLYSGDTQKYLYTGSIGKLLPMIYCAGKETHVGEPYSGLNPNLILSEINRRIEANAQFCESWGSFVTPPPSCLKQTDLKDSYSVQIPRAAAAYYNWMVLKDTPQIILDKIKKVSEEAVASVLEERTKQVTAYLLKSNYPLQVSPWDVEVKTYEEVYARALETHGEVLIQYLNQQIPQWIDAGVTDDRELTIKIVDAVYGYYPEKKPLVILLFAPPYYPSCFNEGLTTLEIAALTMVDELLAYAQSTFDITLEPCAFFPGLSDNSYFGVKDGQTIVHEFKPNMPLWGITYDLPLDTLEKINVPVLNIGTLGKDPHKYTERLNLPYSLTVTPRMIMKCLEKI
jgi:arginine utilization protein RocB